MLLIAWALTIFSIKCVILLTAPQNQARHATCESQFCSLPYIYALSGVMLLIALALTKFKAKCLVRWVPLKRIFRLTPMCVRGISA